MLFERVALDFKGTCLKKRSSLMSALFVLMSVGVVAAVPTEEGPVYWLCSEVTGPNKIINQNSFQKGWSL